LIPSQSELEYFVRKEDGTWAGILQLNTKLEVSTEDDVQHCEKAANNHTCDLVVISEGYCVEGLRCAGMNEEDVEERPSVADGAKYEFYNVLWVEWEEGIAYRKGCGRVVKHLWDSQDPEWFDLVLG